MRASYLGRGRWRPRVKSIHPGIIVVAYVAARGMDGLVADEGVSRDEKEKPSARRGVVSFEENSRVPTASGREVSFTDDSAEAKSTKSSMQGGSMLDLVTGVAESVSSLAEGISVVQGTSAAIGGANKQGSSSSEEPSNRTLG
mgnify:CR=1 FL=1